MPPENKSNFIVRFFGSSKCSDCAKVFVLLNKNLINYEYIDALDESEEIQNFCDLHNVERLPHLEFILNDNIIYTHIGFISEKQLINICSKMM